MKYLKKPCNNTLRVEHKNPASRLLRTKQLPEITGFSASYFEHARVKCRGPRYIKIGARVLYRENDILDWLAAHERNPESRHSI